MPTLHLPLAICRPCPEAPRGPIRFSHQQAAQAPLRFPVALPCPPFHDLGSERLEQGWVCTLRGPIAGRVHVQIRESGGSSRGSGSSRSSRSSRGYHGSRGSGAPRGSRAPRAPRGSRLSRRALRCIALRIASFLP